MNVDPATERHRITRMAGGDAEALAELYDAHAGAIYSLAVRIVGDRRDAEEVVQEVFAQAWRQASRYDAGRATVIGWLLMMTRARALDRLRANHARPDGHSQSAVMEQPSGAPTQEALLLSDEAVAHVREALNGLEESLRVPIELAYYEGLSQSEIAARLDQPLGTIKTRIRTAIGRLRSALWAEESQ
jgi:RNA polymerase sigma-70 factor (ECF subfamily)